LLVRQEEPNVDGVEPLTEPQIRAAFVNLTKGEAKRLNVPKDLPHRPWDDLDYFGWRDPQSPTKGYLVAPLGGRLMGLALRAPTSSSSVSTPSLCALCLTPRKGGVALMVAPRAGKAGQQGHSVGTYMCEDLACSLYLRGKLHTGTLEAETLDLDQRIARLLDNLTLFFAKAVGSLETVLDAS
jgi:hypothetical protein